MSTFLCVTVDGGGNLPPMITVARELQARGHDVRVMGHPAQSAAVAAAGLSFVPYATAKPFRCTDENSPFAWSAMLADRAMGRDVMAELRRTPADLVVIDYFAFGPLEAVANAGVPYVLMSHTIEAWFANKWMRGPMGLGLRLRRFRVSELLAGARVRVVPTLRELDPAGASAGASLAYTGPLVSGRPAAPSEPTVLASLSTVGFPGMRAVLQNIVDALGSLPVRGIVTTGPVIDPAELDVPGNVAVQRFVPHAELMPQVSLVIGHGGHDTTMLALAHDLPVVVLPMHPMADQKMIGAALQRAGAGRLLPKKSKSSVIADAASALLADGPHRAAAARLGAAIRAADGPRKAADLVESALSQDLQGPPAVSR